MNKLTREQKEKAVEIAIAGGKPLDYLADCGAKNPSGAWFQIKKKLAEADPEKMDELRRAQNRKAEHKWREKQKSGQEETPTVKVDGPLKIETPERNLVQVVETPETLEDAMTGMKNAAETFFKQCGLKQEKITEPLTYDGLTVTAVTHPDLGEFYYDKKFTCIDWRTPEGDEVSLTPAWWIAMAHELKKILNVLGVDA